MHRFVTGCLIVAMCLWATACAGGGDSKTTITEPAGAKTAATSPDGGGGASALGDLSTTVDLSLGGQGYPLTMKAPKGAEAHQPGGAVVTVLGGAGSGFALDVYKLDTPFERTRVAFQSQGAPRKFVKFIVDEPGALIYQLHLTTGGQNVDVYRVYAEPSGAPGYFCTTPNGSDGTEQQAEAVLAACKTLTAK